MEAPPWIREDEDHIDSHLFHPPVFSKNLLKFSGDDTSESRNAKRKVENGYDLFCVLRKRTRRQISDDAEDDEVRNVSESDLGFDDLVDEEDCCSSGSDTNLSDSSEFDVISEQHVLQDLDCMGELTGSESLPICNFAWPREVNEENGVSSKDDDVLSSVSTSPKELQHIVDPQICYGHSNDMSCIPEIYEDSLRCSINKEDQEIPCNSAIEVRLGDVVSMQGSLEKSCSNGDIRMWNQPIPISIVPPDGESSMLLETCSSPQIVGCINEYNVCDDNTGLEISPIHLTKTLERPNRPWLVCGSVAAARNIPLLKNGSGACSSLDKQLYANLSSSENRDEELTQAPLTLYQEEVDDEDEISFSDIDAMICRFKLLPDASESFLNRAELNMSMHPRHTLFGLEHCTKTAMRRATMSHGALAVLQCRDSMHFIRKREVIIGRSTDSLSAVDIDLGKDGYGSKISRHQALLKLENSGSFSIKNLGKRHVLVNGEKLNTGQIIRGIVCVFKINEEAVRQLSKNNKLRKSVDEEDTKFRWCE